MEGEGDGEGGRRGEVEVMGEEWGRKERRGRIDRVDNG